MTDNQDDFSIIRTKLHRPRVPQNHVHREMLVERLQSYRRRPAILVSAAAGYGKSTLVSSWLEMCGRPSAWLSLDENDNELQMFLVYFTAAVQSLFPDSLTNSAAMVIAPNLPPVPGIVNQMANELDAIDQDFVLVLDDIHHIQKESINDFLDGLLRHPPRPMHLVLIGRRDPRFPFPPFAPEANSARSASRTCAFQMWKRQPSCSRCFKRPSMAVLPPHGRKKWKAG